MKKYTIILGIISVFFLTSCVKIDINQTINKDGTSPLKIDIDMTSLLQMSESLPKQDKSNSGTLTSSSSTSNTDPCEDIKKNQYINATTCTNVSTGIINIVGTTKTMENKWLSMKNGVYIYDLRKIEKIMNGDKDESIQKADSGSTNSFEGPGQAAMGFKYTYNLTMPGEIIYSDIGTISGSTLTMDYFEVIKLKTAYVVSKDVGVTLTAYEAKNLIQKMSDTVVNNTNVVKREIKVLSQKQQKQVRDAIDKIDKTRLPMIINKIDVNISKIQAKKIKFTKDRKNIQILEDVKTLIGESL